MLGKKSGLDSIRIKAAELGLDVPEERYADLLAAVKELGTRKRGLVDDAEFVALVHQGTAVTERVCVAGAGVIGSLFAGHLAQVAEVSVLTRREEHARALNDEGIRVVGPRRPPRPRRRVDRPRGASGARARARLLQGHRPRADRRAPRRPLRGRDGDDGAERPRRRRDPRRATATGRSSPSVTFMSGTRHSDTHVEYILDTATWIGPSRGTTGDDARSRRGADRARPA